MNIEIFLAALAALVAYRVLSPLIDAINPLTILTKSKAVRTGSMFGEGRHTTAGTRADGDLSEHKSIIAATRSGMTQQP